MDVTFLARKILALLSSEHRLNLMVEAATFCNHRKPRGSYCHNMKAGCERVSGSRGVIGGNAD
jgi:hypothetical protein